ncbi:hypothetical protein ACP4OV_024305 [Aristida adscensionis]
MEEGFFSNLMNDGNTSMSWDGISGLPEEDNSPPIIESISMPPIVEKTPTANARPNQKRSKNFNDKEDELLVSAWLNISTDAIYGTNQSRGTFWKQVYDYFHSNKEFESDRTQSSRLHRWGAIQENVNKFCGCVSQIEKRRQSGCTYQDKLVQSMVLFKAQDKDNKSFQYMHCYNILRNQAKWHDKQKQMAAPQKQSTNKRQKAGTDATPATSTPNTANNTSNEDTENRPPEHDARKRPMGKKKAKELLRGGGTAACVEALDHSWAKKKEFDTERESRGKRSDIISHMH